MIKRKCGSTLLKSLGLSVFLASQTVLLQGCGALGIEAPESGVVASSEITTTEAVEAASTVSSVEENKADPVIYRVSDGSKEKDYYFEELDNDIYDYGKLRFNIIANGKSYVFFEREYPENNYDRAYRLGIVDLETREYKEVPVESELVDLCKNYTDDLEGYEENGDNYFEVAPDETSYHEALRIFSDENENAGVYFSRFGVDKEGNVFALVHFGHVYWGNGQLNFEDGDYELLKWSPEGEFQLPRKVFNEDSLSEMMADEAVGYDAYGDEYNRFMHLLKDNGEFLADIECIGKVSDQQFVGFFFDNENSELHMGIFTQTEGSAKESDSLSDCLWTRDEAKEITIPLEFSLQEGRHELYIPAYSEEAKMEYRKDGEKAYEFRTTLPVAIKEVLACDISFDGIIDLIVVEVNEGNQERVVLYEGEMPEYEGDSFCFGYISLGEAASADLEGVYDVQEIKNYFTQGLENGQISSYGDAYRAVIHYNLIRDFECSYNLVYINEDDVPELVCDCGVLDVYSFSDGLVTQPMVTCPYGVGGCVYYECAPYKNSIRTFGHGTENYYDTYYEIKDGALTRLYAREGFYDSEKVNYENYTDEQLTDEELEARMSERDSYEYEEIHWKYTYKEVLELLP